MSSQGCDNCPLRKKYDQAPKSFLGRFWRWHINWCPGWKKYFAELDEEKKEVLRKEYGLK